MQRIALILGSAPDVIKSREWPRKLFHSIVAINNAWAVRADWDFLVHADDFPSDRMPRIDEASRGSLITSVEFVPAQNQFGGFVYAGGTMAFTAAYWALAKLKPSVLVFAGCDMIYETSASTHFYGKGSPDPLRDDLTLKSLEAKSGRLFCHALVSGTVCLNLSQLPETRLAIPRVSLPFLEKLNGNRVEALKAMLAKAVGWRSAELAAKLEAEKGYFVENGRYWEHVAEFDEAYLSTIDQHWLAAITGLPKSVVPSQGCWGRHDRDQAA